MKIVIKYSAAAVVLIASGAALAQPSPPPAPPSAVQSVFGRTGAVVMGSPDVVTALGFTPYNAANPSNYVNAAGAAAAAPVQSVAGRTGSVILGSSDVTTALGFTPFSAAGGTISGPVVITGNTSLGAIHDATTVFVTPSNGATQTMAAGTDALMLLNATSITQIVRLPPITGLNGQQAIVSSTGGVSAVTVQTNAGVAISNSPAAIGAASAVYMISNGTSWLPLNNSVRATIAQSLFITTSQTVNLPIGWASITWKAVGGGGGGGCGVVGNAGVALSGGGGGGAALQKLGVIYSAQWPGVNTIVVSIGAGGATCVASGTTSGSTGSAPNQGGTTTLAMSGITFAQAFAGGAGSNGAIGVGSAGGGSAGNVNVGGNAVGATGGVGGNGGGLPGGAGTGGAGTTQPGAGAAGGGSGIGAAGSVGGPAHVPGVAGAGSGGGLAVSDIPLAGGSSGASYSRVIAAGGLATCTGTSQNGSAATWLMADLDGFSGSGGASCPAGNGGNGGSATGYGAPGAGGGATEVGNLAGSGGVPTGGAVILGIN